MKYSEEVLEAINLVNSYGGVKVYVCNGKEGVDVVNLIIDHGEIIING